MINPRPILRGRWRRCTLLCALALTLSGQNISAAGESNHRLWQIGVADNSDAEFALAPADYGRFLQSFGAPDRAYYIGLSSPRVDWSAVLPGPSDAWAGSRSTAGLNILWDQMNTLPIGFVLAAISSRGECAFTIKCCDSSPKDPPHLRVTINGAHFERDLAPGGSDGALRGDFSGAKPQVIEIRFPASLLKPGYNEIALRSTRGSWCVFDALSLDAPAEVKLAPPASTVIRAVAVAPHAVSPRAENAATVRVEFFRQGSPGELEARIGDAPPRTIAVAAGLHVVEIAAPAGEPGRATSVRLRVDGRLLFDGGVNLIASPPATPADYVNVFTGTAHSRWMIAPGPWMPNGMVKISPDNQPQSWCAGYDYGNEHIDCFSHIHEWTMAGLGMMPTVGALRTRPGLDANGYSSRFDKATERGGIGFYEVVLQDSGIKVELAATTRATLQRYTFPAADEARVLLPFLLQNEYEMHVLGARVRRVGADEIEGDIETMLGPNIYGCEQRYILHFVSQFSRPFDALGGWENLGGPEVTYRRGLRRPVGDTEAAAPQKLIARSESVALSGDCGAFVVFKTTGGEKVEVRTGISLVSVANARLNLARELSGPFGWDFAAVVQNQRRVWNELLSSVEIETPDARERSRFYSNFYRALSGRTTWSDVNGEWVDPAGRVQKLDDPSFPMLGSDAFWNTFWNLNQVMNLITPRWSVAWVKSQLQLYDKCGWLSKGPAGLKYINVMQAEHEIALLVAAYQAGLKDLDPEKMLAAAIKMQTSLPAAAPGGGKVGNRNLDGYLKYGYVPHDGPLKGRTSNTSEYAYDDWTVAQLALALGQKDVAEKFLQRSRNWRNIFDPEIGFVRPRLASGKWLEPFDPYHTPGFTEGNAWQYTWFVPQDVPALVEVMGRERFIARLNDAFEKSAPTRFNAGGRAADYPINQGNQPTMQVAWLFNWAGAPWLSQKWTHAILDAYYGFNPADAYLGDEDQGQMSAWFMMSALGLFQTDGGCRVDPVYELGSPLYPKTTLHLSKKHYGGKAFIIEARHASSANRYIQSATLNGRPLNQWWIRQKEVIAGGSLVFELGPTPNVEWGKSGPVPRL